SPIRFWPSGRQAVRPSWANRIHLLPPSPHSAHLRLEVDQGVAALGQARPWLNLDDVIQGRALHSQANFSRGAPQCALLSRARRCLRIAREQLQLRRSGSEAGELEDQPLDRAGRRRLLESYLERRDDAAGIGGRLLEQMR